METGLTCFSNGNLNINTSFVHNNALRADLVIINVCFHVKTKLVPPAFGGRFLNARKLRASMLKTDKFSCGPAISYRFVPISNKKGVLF